MVSGTGPKWAQNSDFSTKMPEKYLSDQFFFVFLLELQSKTTLDRIIS
jgi:hypothetical protein